jgi:hypothetical protein
VSRVRRQQGIGAQNILGYYAKISQISPIEWYNVITTNTRHKGEIAMTNYNTLGNRLKVSLLVFANKVSKGHDKPTRKFLADMIYGIVAAGSCKLTEIGRTLKEDIALKKTVERLGRHLSRYSERETLKQNYIAEVKRSLGADTMLIIDGGDVAKPCSPKMEAIGYVYDASEGKYANGYWTMGAVALSDEKQQPVPVYENLYPCKKQGGLGSGAETAKCLQYLRENFGSGIPRVLDRGFDSGATIMGLAENDEKFILRVNQNRVAVHNGKRSYIGDIARGVVCEHGFEYKGKNGKVSRCKIGITQVVLPNLKNTRLNLIVCKEYGETPLVLYTNLSETLESIAVRVVKAYLMRWRIEEFYAFKKQSLRFEDFRVRGLDSIITLDLLLTVAAGFIAMLCEKSADKTVVELVAVSKRIPKTADFLRKTKVIFYAVHDGVAHVLASLRCGISRFFASCPRDNQLCLAGFEKMG